MPGFRLFRTRPGGAGVAGGRRCARGRFGFGPDEAAAAVHEGIAATVALGVDRGACISKACSAPLDYVDANKGKAMNRFLELVIIAERAMADTSNRDELLKWGPGKLMVILEGPLKENCIAKR